MKKMWISLISVLTLSLSAWALTQTGMPALDDLYGDLAVTGPLSHRLGFTDRERTAIMTYIVQKAGELQPLRDAFVAAERQPGADKQAAYTALDAAREVAFHGLKELMTANQYDALKAWREEGKDRARSVDKNPPVNVTQIGLPALNDLHHDLTINGPISRRLDFSERQRKELLKYIAKQTESMQEVKADTLEADRKVERKEEKGASLKEAKVERKEADRDLVAKRENALHGLKSLMTDRQYDGLTKWLEERTGQ